ncbi:exosome complex protein Rrp42 [Candidatus Woesearchaeota archaeon]|nr:exosome complex protein Rrp42 [Candidatus Woesearchaeota archaeon]
MEQIKLYLLNALNKGRRLDGRNTLDYRDPVKVEYGVTKTAEGSAKVTIGDTVVIAGVKLEIGKPYPDTPNQGSIMVGAELVPLASPEFEQGPPSIDAVELARVVDRGIRESKAIDFEALCIEKGEKAWVVIIDLVPLNDDGNLFDASALAAMAAVKNTRFPAVTEDGIDYKSKTDEGLKLNECPISVTVHKVGEYFIVDPTREEARICDARLTIAIMESGELCALQKGGEKPLSQGDVSRMIDIAIDKASMLRGVLENGN